MNRKLTAKERKVLESLKQGLYLRQKRFSDLWEVAPTYGRLGDGLYTVSGVVIRRLESDGLIAVAIDRTLMKQRFLISQLGQSLIED